jgi:dihydrofolate synthase/folylpolyglutamate synthase
VKLAEAERWLDGLINREREPRASYSRFGLDAIVKLLARLGNPERGLSVVHVAGSKGKGSTALLVEALLGELGESVGTFTSPHLERWTERFRIDGREVGGDALAEVVSAIRPHVDDMRREDAALWPSFFDATTAAALLLFARSRLDRVVLEVGLGGRLDSTNAVTPAVTCVTSIEYEHTDKLGDTLAAIAGEKAGILKPGAPCVTGRLPAEAAAVVEAKAADLGVPLRRLGAEFAVQGPRFSTADGFAFEAPLCVPGRHQRENAAVALAAVRSLGAHADARIVEAAQRAFARVSLPGRIEVVERDPWVVIDSAHTRESVRALIGVLEDVPVRSRHFVLSVSRDKALDGMLELLLPFANELTATRAEPIRALDPAELAARAASRGKGVAVHVVEDPREAVRAARARLGRDGLLCVVGSVYLAGIARSVLLR